MVKLAMLTQRLTQTAQMTRRVPKGTSKSQSVHNPRELDDARYAALDCRAHSDQARALVAAVTDLVAAHELASGTRTNKRKKKQTALSSAVEAPAGGPSAGADLREDQRLRVSVDEARRFHGK